MWLLMLENAIILNNVLFSHFSSRFTDSKRYEAYFEKCFSLEELRSGEICNACVLLVKRFIKLPAGSTRHWNHVVDARSGPGIKSMVKSKKAKTDTSNTKDENDTPEKINKKHFYRSKVNRKPVSVRKRNPSIQPSGFLDMNRWTKWVSTFLYNHWYLVKIESKPAWSSTDHLNHCTISTSFFYFFFILSSEADI